MIIYFYYFLEEYYVVALRKKEIQLKTYISKISGDKNENSNYNLFSSPYYDEFLKILKIEDILIIENFEQFLSKYEAYITQLELKKNVKFIKKFKFIT